MYTKTQLMEEIIANKTKDLKCVEFLCGDLLELANYENDSYAKAFAHAYLANSNILQRHHTACLQHMKEAQVIAEEYHYHDLLLLIYNIGGIYYKSHFDEITAIKYYLDAYNLAVEVDDAEEILVALNNIAELFSKKNDFSEALSYLKRAYEIFQKKGGIISSQRSLVLIMNIVQMYIFTNQLQKAEEIYDLYEHQLRKFYENPLSDAIIRLCHMYLMEAKGHLTEVKKEADYFIENHFQKLEENRTVCFNFYSDVYDLLLKNKDRHRSEMLLQRMGEVCLNDDIEQQLRLHLSWIQFAETFHLEDALIQSYKQYYLLQKMVTDITNSTKVESMKEKILLNHMIKEHEIIEHEKQMLETKVKIDELTRLFNRSYFNQLYAAMKENANVTNIGLILVDIDYFKEFNDYYGHFQGDCLLKRIARCLDESGDSRFFTARFGGDEFIILCVNISEEDVTQYMDNVYLQLANHQIEHVKSKIGNTATISSGIAIFDNNEAYDLETSLTLTDAALYEAKQAGKNRYITYIY